MYFIYKYISYIYIIYIYKQNTAKLIQGWTP